MNSGQVEEKDASSVIEALFTDGDAGVIQLDDEAWVSAPPVAIKRYWSGEDAPPGRHAEARLLWSKRALSLRFVCRQTEPLIVSARPQLERKTIGLWDRDVCELFIAPDTNRPERYFEFEAAPTGEWLDLSVHLRPDVRETNWDFHSGMKAAARLTSDTVIIGSSSECACPGKRWGVCRNPMSAGSSISSAASARARRAAISHGNRPSQRNPAFTSLPRSAG
jgi:hypothetical protein